MTIATVEGLGLDPLPLDIQPKITEPPNVEWNTADGIFIKQIYFRNANTYMRQHAHTYDHTTLLARGSVFIWQDGKLDGRYEAPKPIMIKAGVWHTFLSLEDDTLLYCIHRLGNQILEKHGLSQEDL